MVRVYMRSQRINEEGDVPNLLYFDLPETINARVKCSSRRLETEFFNPFAWSIKRKKLLIIAVNRALQEFRSLGEVRKSCERCIQL